MPLKFNGSTLPGINGPPLIGPPLSRAIRTDFNGVNGASEIRLGRGGRGIEYPVWIFGSQFSSFNSVIEFLRGLDLSVNTHGTLSETGTVSRSFEFCTFDGFDNQGFPILPVVGSGMTGTHWTRGIVRFFQLRT